MEAREIRQLRESLGVSQDEFAKLLRVSYTTVSRWENSIKSPDEETEDQLRILKKLVDDPDIDKKKVKHLMLAAGLSVPVALGVLSGLAVVPVLGGALAALIGIKGMVSQKEIGKLLKKEKEGKRK